ncbi:MAG: preprotein translocase subunit SecE [Prochlorococcaceae cyanobacterium]
MEPDSPQSAQSRSPQSRAEAATATETAPGSAVGAAGAAEGADAGAPQPVGFAAATVDELRKVVWPSRQQLFSESVAVILMVGLSAAAIAAIDRLFGWAASQVFR